MDHSPYVRGINYYETDQMAVVHHSNYIRFFEEARVDYLKRNGLDFFELEKEYGIMFPVLDVACKYVNSAKFSDTLLIYMKLKKFTGVRFTLEYDMRFAGNNEQCAYGATTLGILNSEYRPISIKRKFPEKYVKFMEILEEDCKVE